MCGAVNASASQSSCVVLWVAVRKQWKQWYAEIAVTWVYCVGSNWLWTELSGGTALFLFAPGWVINPHQNARTVTSLCNDCFASQENSPYIKLSLLRGAAAVRMQCLGTICIVYTHRVALHQVPLRRNVTAVDVDDVCRMTERYCKHVSRSWQGVKLACKHCCPLHQLMRLLMALHQQKIAQQ